MGANRLLQQANLRRQLHRHAANAKKAEASLFAWW